MITIAGAGTGSDSHLTPEVKDAINDSDVIFASSRFQNLIPSHKTFHALTNFSQAFDLIASIRDSKVLILVSGDPGIYSLLPLVKKRFPHEKINVLPGISSLQIICAHACEKWNDAKILSGHGRELSSGKFLNAVERNRVTILFCDKVISPKWACEKLAELVGNIEVVIGENLGSSDERILTGKPEEFIAREFSELSIMLIKNHNVYKPHNLRDKDFHRLDKIVMTNENVRAVILSKLGLDNEAIFWDIGAGTGSVSIEAANFYPDCEIHAIEHKPEAAKLISLNAAKFHVHNINIYNDRAMNLLETLPKPSHVFIGGSDGELTCILEYLAELENNIRVVVACVTLENFNAAYEFMKDMKDFEVVQISVTSSKSLKPELTLMSANNPVMILSCEMVRRRGLEPLCHRH